ncbi:hypothetical protein [Flavobacterium piscis]|uniref:Uncharacterized protein n=1 Tax=Flavobacterium piscis TaxID=1114874 RepID=A0ABU1Y577_9FLAO|nr:hypothetical protein [Flavobacterium piscis]MDR7208825.1 hypothetical protein [Flavobacterium piscis]
MGKKFDGHIYLKIDIDSTTSKMYYFRHNDNDMDYECEEFIYKNKQVLDLKYGESSKEYFDKILSDPDMKGSSPIVYYECKGMGWKSFGEEISIDELQ